MGHLRHSCSSLKLSVSLLTVVFFAPYAAFAQEQTSDLLTNRVNAETPAVPSESNPPEKSNVSKEITLASQDMVQKAWELSSKNDLDGLLKLAGECFAIYGQTAKSQAESLKDFPIRGQEKYYQALNDVATVNFIKAEALMNNGKTEEAVPQFQKLIDEYHWAQAWDPSRGAYWSIAEKSQASIDMILGKMEEKEALDNPLGIKSSPPVFNPGTESVVNYQKYGDFVGVGTKDYKYVPGKPKALAAAVGYGIYPSNTNVQKLPEYLKVKQDGRLEGNHWDFMRSNDLEAAYFKWLNAPEPTGVRLFYQGLIFEKAKMYLEAIKAYHALVVNFPNTVSMTYWQTPWYPAQAAISKIKHIIRGHPELKLSAQWMKIEVTNGFDNDVNNDVVLTWPGVIKERGVVDNLKDRLNFETKPTKLGKPYRTMGTGQVKLVQYENKHWKMLVDGKPFVIRGVTYAPTKVGQSPDKATIVSWMKMDNDKNGILDGPYEAWVDKNKNNIQDTDESAVGDFKLMKDMGVNTIREYYQPFKPEKEALRKMYKDFGFKVIMGNFLGKYTHGSGASWSEGTNYSNAIHQENMLKSVREMVMDLKDEPYILMWVLGNENNYGVANNADKDPISYYKFVNIAAKMIHELDPNHPVAICNGDTLFLDLFAQYAPEVDIFGANVYRGDYGFGSFWEQVQGATDKPAFITEYGSPAYAKHLTFEQAEEEQADYHRGNWLDIDDNLAGRPEGIGNAIGGVAFEWVDEWWKNYEPFYHDKKSDAIGPFAGGYYYEEWFGLISQGNGKRSPFMRHLRKAYFVYKELWNSKG